MSTLRLKHFREVQPRLIFGCYALPSFDETCTWADLQNFIIMAYAGVVEKKA